MAPQLGFGATFVPGSDDDYFMPEVVAPSPQRYAFQFYFTDPCPPSLLGPVVLLSSISPG